MGYYVVHHQGSFIFRDRFGTRDEAMARALSLKGKSGIWHIRVEDEAGKLIQIAESERLFSGLPFP